jgi:flagellar motor switch/type III secretory pathway protein FliN
VPFFVTDNQYPAGAERRGSGAIVVSFTVGSLAFDYIISPVTLERYIENMEKPVTEARPRLVPMPAALGNQKIRASVSLGSAELSLGELATIRVGDVVTLDRLVDQPASMRFGTDCHGCRGFIGVKDGALAFRVSRTEK